MKSLRLTQSDFHEFCFLTVLINLILKMLLIGTPRNHFFLKGQSQGHNAIVKGLKMTFRKKNLKKTIPR